MKLNLDQVQRFNINTDSDPYRDPGSARVNGLRDFFRPMARKEVVLNPHKVTKDVLDTESSVSSKKRSPRDPIILSPRSPVNEKIMIKSTQAPLKSENETDKLVVPGRSGSFTIKSP